MKDLDQKIQAALQREGADPELTREPNIAQEVITATFRGRHRALMTFAFIYTFALFIAAVWAGVKFYHAPDVSSQIQWGGLALLLMMMVAFIKVWFWLEMHTNRVLRELKRLELLLATRRPGP
jgi:hypothetical protein